MGCQTQVTLGNNLTFTIVTHDPDTGVLTDADSAPAYRIYEDETSTPILTGTMTKLDDANTTGFYSELIACTTANGFEIGKSYNVYIEATVDSDTGGISYSFTVTATGNIFGTAQGGTATYITLAAGESATEQLHRGNLIAIIDGTGVGQRRIITNYNGTSKAAIIAPNWYTNPDATSIYVIFSSGHADITMIQNAPTSATNLTAIINDLLDGGRLDLLIDAITTHLTDVKGTGFVKDTNSLVDLAHTGANGDTLKTLSDQIDDVTTLGTGAITFTYTLTSSVDASAIADADVWVTSDSAGNNLLASGRTNSSGQVTFYLDAGTVYVWRQKDGWNFDNPDIETVA